MPRGAVDSSVHYCPRPQEQECTELSSVQRVIALTILPNDHEITVLLPNNAMNHQCFTSNYKLNWCVTSESV